MAPLIPSDKQAVLPWGLVTDAPLGLPSALPALRASGACAMQLSTGPRSPHVGRVWHQSAAPNTAVCLAVLTQLTVVSRCSGRP